MCESHDQGGRLILVGRITLHLSQLILISPSNGSKARANAALSHRYARTKEEDEEDMQTSMGLRLMNGLAWKVSGLEFAAVDLVAALEADPR